jgi:alpha-2-macroglobulin
MRISGLFMIALLILAQVASFAPADAQETSYIPDRRLVLTENADLPGGDIQSIFDTTLEACETSCLANGQCRAITFNTKANSCFLKSGTGDQQPYVGAYSGFVLAGDNAVLSTAAARAAELGFLGPVDFDAALTQARRLGRDHLTNNWTADDLLSAAASARNAGDLRAALRYQGAALNLTDAADQWVEYAQLLSDLSQNTTGNREEMRGRALSASVNGYLRANRPALRASALLVMARALQDSDRGRDMIPALRLAQSIQPRDDAAALLDDAIAKYGFRIAEHRVDSDAARPRICATFNSRLIASGTDYAPFVQLPETGLSVEASDRQICIDGVTHGKRYAVTFRQGLPAADGEVLAKDTTLQLYIRDRAASISFPGRAYILPRAAQSGIPVQTVNTAKLDLTLQRISDRNLVRAMVEDYLARPLDYYTAEYFNRQFAEEVWRGAADMANAEPNRDVTTRLPLDAVLQDLGPGIYMLQASIPGADPEQTPPGTQWFVISDLGLTSMSGTDGLHLFVRGLGDARARPGVKATLLSRANSVIGTAMTDDQGYAHFAPAMVAGKGSSAPAMITIEAGEDFSFLSLTDPEFDLSDRGVSGRAAAPAIDVFLTTDRGAYRAGETLNATVLARDPNVKAINGLPLTARLIRPDGVEYNRVLAADGGGGGRALSLPIGAGAPRGTWRIEVFAEEKGPTLASQSFLVEDFLPERIDFTLAAPEGPLRLSDAPEISISARYLFGAPGADLPIEGDYRISAADRLAAFPGYEFGKYDDAFSPYYDSLSDPGQTDAEGNGTARLVIPDLGPAANRPLTARVALRLAEGSGRPVERSIERIILPDTPIIGIKPAFKDGAVAENTEARFDLIAVGPDGQATSRAVHWRLNRLETHYQWYALYGQWNWDVTTTRSRVAEGDVTLSPDGAVSIAAKVDWGNYELVVESAGGEYSAASTRFYAGWYAPADAAQTPDTLELSLDQPAYRAGDTAKLRIVPRAAGVALINVVSNHLIAMQAVNVTAGENIIDLPVTDEWGAGAYVTASVIRPLDAGAATRAPTRALGLSYAPVDPGTKRLGTSIEVAPEVAPRGPLPVAVKVDGITPGETAYITLAAVDVGILNLTAFKSPDPDGHYFGQQKLGMAIHDLYGRLIDGQNGAMGVVRSGGDAGGVKLQSPPPTEELVAYFSGPIAVGADGYARTEFDLPSFNGTVRLMAVAWSDSAVGQAEADVLVHDPVVVTASVPRFLAPGDQTTLRLELVHADGPSGRMGLDITAEGLVLGDAPSGVDLADQGKVKLSVPLHALASEGDATLRIALTTPDGKQLIKTLVIPVQSNDPEISRQSQFTLAAGQEFTLDDNVFAGFIPGSGKATLALGPIARFNAPGILASLDRYPYGCTEQLTSKAMPLLYFEEVAAAMGAGDTTGIRERVQQAITEVLANQSSNGAFGLWYADSGDMWLDAYVGDFLSRARAQGYAVPDTAFRNAMDNLRNQINYAPDFDQGGGAMAYALMVLAREGAAAMGDLRYYADVKAEAFDTPMAAAQLGAALASYGDQTRADAMFKRAAMRVAQNAAVRANTPEAQIWRADYGTNLRDATALLALGAEAGTTAFDANSLGQSVAASLLARPLSTQEATWALLATHAQIDRAGAGDFTINGAPLTGPLVRVIDNQRLGDAQIIANAATQPATLTLTTFGVPETPEPAGGNGYKITRNWYTIEGAPVALDAIPQGSRLVAVIEVLPLGDGEARLMVNDPLPAGFEIDNPNLIRAGDIAALDWLTTNEDTRNVEFRQERFLAAVDWSSRDAFRLAYIVRAISPGSYYLPAASVEDMYRPDFRARSDAGTVTITE